MSMSKLWTLGSKTSIDHKLQTGRVSCVVYPLPFMPGRYAVIKFWLNNSLDLNPCSTMCEPAQIVSL